MSGNQNQDKSQDVFTVYQENCDKIFEGIRKTVPQFHQSITNLQQECLQSCEGAINASNNARQAFVSKAGISTLVPQTALKAMKETTEEIVKANGIKHQLAIATIDATQQNIKTFHDNAKMFNDLYIDYLQSWFSLFSKKN